MTDDDVDQKSFPEIAVWNVVFMDGERGGWWDVLTCPGYRHVCAFGFNMESNGWVLIDPRRSHTAVHCLSHDGLMEWLEAHDHRITETFRIGVDDGRKSTPWLGYWCTTSIKRLCGIACGAFTPKGLRDELVRRNAEPVFTDAQSKTA